MAGPESLYTTAIQGFAFGMVLQLSVGPVCIAVFQKGVAESRSSALWMVGGVALADALYITFALAGVATVLEIGAVRYGIGLLGAATLAVFGFRAIWLAARPVPVSGNSSHRGGSLRYGFTLTLTNPLTAIFWTGVFAGLAAGSTGGRTDLAVVFGLGCVASTLAFLSAVALLGHSLGGVLASRRTTVFLNRAVGALLLVFAGQLAVNVIFGAG